MDENIFLGVTFVFQKEAKKYKIWDYIIKLKVF